MRKTLLTITILFLISLTGCFYQEQMNSGDYNFNENRALKIITKDSAYYFSGGDYSLVNDTLIGKTSKKLDERRILKLNVEIPMEDIVRVEVEEIDVVASLGIIAGILVSIVIVFLFSCC